MELLVYSNVWPAVFIERTNRFTVLVEAGGEERLCHLHDPGRLTHLLVRGRRVYARNAWRPGRRTSCDIVAVEDRGVLVLEDTRIANKAFPRIAAILYQGAYSVESEVLVPGARIDHVVHTPGGPVYVEAKSTNLAVNRVALFPDSPSQRASRQLDALLRLARRGARTGIVFFSLRSDVDIVRPNRSVDPVFSSKLCGYSSVVEARAVRLEARLYNGGLVVAYAGEIPVEC